MHACRLHRLIIAAEISSHHFLLRLTNDSVDKILCNWYWDSRCFIIHI